MIVHLINSSTEPIPDLVSYLEKPCVASPKKIKVKVITIVTVSLEAH